jgi:hypothetical protein
MLFALPLMACTAASPSAPTRASITSGMVAGRAAATAAASAGTRARLAFPENARIAGALGGFNDWNNMVETQKLEGGHAVTRLPRLLQEISDVHQ